MQLWASSLVNVNIHNIRHTERRGEKEGEGGKKRRKNKGHGKYSKAHAWVLTKCKWKRKSPHQHIAIKRLTRHMQALFQDSVFLFAPFPASPFQLFLSSLCLSFDFLHSTVLLHPHPSLSVFFFFSGWSIEHLWVQRPYYHKRETVCHCEGPEVERTVCLCVSVCAHPSWVEATYSPGCP